MEKVEILFFFANANQKFNTLYSLVRRDFGELFDNSQQDRQRALQEHFGRSFTGIIREGEEQRLVESAEIGKEYNIDTRRLSFYEYHAFKKDYYKKIKAANKRSQANGS